LSRIVLRTAAEGGGPYGAVLDKLSGMKKMACMRTMAQ